MDARLFFVVFISLWQLAVAGQVEFVRLHQDGETGMCTFLSQETLKKYKGFRSPEDDVSYRVRPAVIPPPGEPATTHYQDDSKIIEIYARNEKVLKSHISKFCKSTKSLEPIHSRLMQQQNPEIFKMVDSGNQSNRIDVVFMGDGYTTDERIKFFTDMQRLITEMFQGVTFRSFLPLFNIWAIFIPSTVSGIGYDGPINTPFRLYRQSGQLRAIFTGNAAYARQVCALTGTSGCEYPSLIGNDDFYGGLGGEFVISTESESTGTIVLRHEMGHNFAVVGEEYDGGSVYSGVNSARSLTSLGWTAWLSDPSNIREERAAYRLLEYVWADLGTRNVTFNFNSDGTYSRWFMTVSVTASGEPDCLEFLMDGVPLDWTSTGSDDREFYEWLGDRGFSAGSHTLTVRSKTTPTHPTVQRMLASIDLHEFGGEGSEFNIDNEHVSAYPTWSAYGTKTYRPTNAGCLMRNMTHERFCSVCQEGIWYQFLRRVSLIDDLIVEGRNVVLRTLQLGQLRQPGNEVAGEALQIRWRHQGIEQPLLDDVFQITNAPVGSWSVTVTLETPEVRADPQNLLTETETFTIA